MSSFALRAFSSAASDLKSAGSRTPGILQLSPSHGQIALPYMIETISGAATGGTQGPEKQECFEMKLQGTSMALLVHCTKLRN